MQDGRQGLVSRNAPGAIPCSPTTHALRGARTGTKPLPQCRFWPITSLLVPAPVLVWIHANSVMEPNLLTGSVRPTKPPDPVHADQQARMA